MDEAPDPVRREGGILTINRNTVTDY
jgi:hypothetical protein